MVSCWKRSSTSQTAKQHSPDANSTRVCRSTISLPHLPNPPTADGKTPKREREKKSKRAFVLNQTRPTLRLFFIPVEIYFGDRYLEGVGSSWITFFHHLWGVSSSENQTGSGLTDVCLNFFFHSSPVFRFCSDTSGLYLLLLSKFFFFFLFFFCQAL